jgi:hypothetical protein
MSTNETGSNSASSDASTSTAALALSDEAKRNLVESKVACPFLGSAIAQGTLAVRNHPDNPLASIEQVRELGNSGGGDLGDLLVFFAGGNHAFMRGSPGKLDKPAPPGMFSLELPGSQGSHPGHSGILEGDSQTLGSGRFSQADFDRLTRRAKNGLIKRSEIGRFIAENLFHDPKSKVADKNVAGLLAQDVGAVLQSAGAALRDRLTGLGSAQNAAASQRAAEQKLTKLLGEDNLVGSAGEFGLLFAFLAHKPDAQELDGEPTVSVKDLQSMFVDKRLPDGWQNWKKSRIDWVTNTTALLVSAGKEYLALKRNKK